MNTTTHAVSGQDGILISLSGLSGSGKSTLARSLVQRLRAEGWLVVHMDRSADHDANARDLERAGWPQVDPEVNQVPEARLDYKEPQYRSYNEHLASAALRLVGSGMVTVLSQISPYRSIRDRLRHELGPERYFEVYVDTPLEICESRDPKQLYQKARRGETDFMPGINSPYEPPEQPLLTIRSLQASDVERAVGAICDQLGLSSLPRESFDGVVLDLFGTLVELPPLEARRALLDGLELSPDSELGRMVAAGAVLAPLMAALGVAYEHGRRLLQTRRFPSIAAAAHALGAAAGGATAAALVSRYERHLAPWYAAYQLAPGAAALLDALVAAGVPIAILSNADSFSAGVVSALGLDRYAKAVLLSCDLGLEKPAAGAFQRAFDALGVDASGAIVIGDGWRSDVEGAVRAGAGAVWINRDGAPSPARLPLPLRRRIIEVPGLATCSRLFADV